MDWKLGLTGWLAFCGAFATFGNCALAQLKPIPDNSLGAQSSVVTPNVDINGIKSDRISGGAIRSANLFHSFQEFNIEQGRGAYFTNPAGIENIFSRVTGGNGTQIFGKLGVLGNANLFLINPSGIIFGKNASLDVKGSFVGTTASSLNFADGIKFSATTPQTTPLLTISVPIGLQFGTNPGKIQVQGDGQRIRSTSGLRVQPNQTLAFVGGDVSLEGATLNTDGGRIELGSVGDNSLVSLTPMNKGFSLGYDTVQNFGNIQLFQQTAVDASGTTGGGDIQVRGRQLTLKDGSQILIGSQLAAGKLTIIASESVELIGTRKDESVPTGLFTSAYGATGVGGELTVETRRLIVKGGAAVSASTFGPGQGGILTVNASDFVEVDGTSENKRYTSTLATGTYGSGNAGNLTINTPRLIVKNGAGVYSPTAGAGEGGILTVNASESVELIGTSTDGTTPSAILVDTLGFSGSKKAGNLTINTGRLIVGDGAAVSVSTFGKGEGGSLEVNASESIKLSGVSSQGFPSGLYAQSFSTGKAGDLTINTRELLIQDRATVSVAAGKAPDSRLISVPSFIQQELRIDIPKILENLQLPPTEIGNAGNLKVTANSIELDNQGTITATTRSGNGGDITLQVQDLLLMRRNSQISTTAGIEQKGGDGGNIKINAPDGFIVAIPGENSDITANAFTGIGGNVQINAFGVYGTQFREKENPETSDITASSTFGINGTVEINTPEIDPNRGLVNLPSVPLETEVSQVCQPRTAENQSSFIITGRGGLPPNPRTELLTPDAVQVDWVTLKPRTENRSNPKVTINPTPATPAPIVEAQGWVRNAKGEVVLTAYAPTATPHNSWQKPAFCHGS